MDSNINELVKLASELTAHVEALETENLQLMQQQKNASAGVPASTVSEYTAANTCNKLVRAGLLSEDQTPHVKRAFLLDPEAAHRTISGILDAFASSKTASAVSPDFTGGRLVDDAGLGKTASEDCIDRMQRILGMN